MKYLNKLKYYSNRCTQPWTAQYIASSISRDLYHIKVREYLNIEILVTLEDEYTNKKPDYSLLSLISQSELSLKLRKKNRRKNLQ